MFLGLNVAATDLKRNRNPVPTTHFALLRSSVYRVGQGSICWCSLYCRRSYTDNRIGVLFSESRITQLVTDILSVADSEKIRSALFYYRSRIFCHSGSGTTPVFPNLRLLLVELSYLNIFC